MKEAIKVNVSWDKSSVLEGGDVVLEYAEQGLNGYVIYAYAWENRG